MAKDEKVEKKEKSEIAEEHFVGLNKGDHHSSVCLFKVKNSRPQIELFLNERLRGVKNAGGWPLEALQALPEEIRHSLAVDMEMKLPGRIAENCFGLDTKKIEEKWDENYLYFEFLKRKGLTAFSSHFNPQIRFYPHHLCHAMSAACLSPFEKSIIVVQDGLGNLAPSFPLNHQEVQNFPPPASQNQQNPHWAESVSVYLQHGAKLECIAKEWQLLKPFAEVRDQHNYDPEDMSDGLGSLFAAGAKFVFNSFFDAGKLMGLAPYGYAREISSRWDFLLGLDWRQQAFKRSGKEAWENSQSFQLYADVAASIQQHFEKSNLELLSSIKEKYSEYENLILTGGCALNCVFNMKLSALGLFKNIYVPPFPGDEGISLGASALLAYSYSPSLWSPIPLEEQTSFLGPLSSQAKADDIKRVFSEHYLEELTPENLYQVTASLLQKGKTVAWFQGRSESGPRALGHRSILANPLQKGIKDYLNTVIKKREAFRPYGASCLWEMASHYFQVPLAFDSPFMSFAPLVKEEFRDALKEICSIDGRSRIQTVRKNQDPGFHQLISEFGKLTGVYCLLNTSLNIMGKPMVETLKDALLFFQSTPVDVLVAESFIISREEFGRR